MSNASSNLILRNDTILGVCEAIGQDFGFHANWLRIALATSFFWFPLQVIGAYLTLGLIVLVSRSLAPVKIAAVEPQAVAAEPRRAEANSDEGELAVAA